MKKILMTLTCGRACSYSAKRTDSFCARSIAALAVFFCCILTLHAQPISEQLAMERALQYMNSNRSSANARRMAAPALKGSKALMPAPTEATKIYAFNIEGGGFVIASGDQRTLPVLGYSTTGSIDWSRMPENMRSWLKLYDEAIATLDGHTGFRDGEQTATPSYGQGTATAQLSRRAARVAVEPLITTHWDQGAPYWDQVPTYQGPEPSLRNKQCYAGCVATAMAQVMNYWQWPNTVPNEIPDYDYNIQYNGQNYTWHFDALPPTKFEWELMLNDYDVWNPETEQYEPLGTDEQRRAVAALMRYCGQSLDMKYGPAEKGGSEAYYWKVARALVNNFDYSAAQFIEHRFFPSIDEWEEIIYGELAAGRPVVYGGQSDSGGHAFVCDGYDGNGLFHINWGWTGINDGYFALAVLNPYNNTSAGSGSSGIGYCIDENATIYIDPKMEPQPFRNGESVGRIYQYVPCEYKDNEVGCYYSFFGQDNEEADFAFGIIDAKGQLQPLFMSDEEYSTVVPYNVIPNKGFVVTIDATMFTAGQAVNLYPMLRFRHPGEQWQIIPPMEQSVTVGRDYEGNFFIRPNLKTYNMQLTGIAITKGTGRLGERSDLTIRVRNYGSSDYIRELYLRPIYLGHIKPEEYGAAPVLAQGPMMKCGAYIPANGEADVTFSFVPEYGGMVSFCAYTDNQYIGELPYQLNNDTLTNYYNYIENNSYLSHDGDQWYWNVELADRQGVKMPHWIPSDNLFLNITFAVNKNLVQRLMLKQELHDYLLALPDNIGTGNYTFTYQMPVDVSKPGEYYFDSYIAEVVNNKLISYCCANTYSFTIDDPTGIEEVKSENGAGTVFDLQGRPHSGKPSRRGLYIQGNKKIFVR